MREYTCPAVLIIDDFAMREHTTTGSDDLYDLVSDRAIAGKPLILTSNRAPKDWYPLFPNPVVAESLLDRLINTSHQILMDGGPIAPAHDSDGHPRRPPEHRELLSYAEPSTREHGELRDGKPLRNYVTVDMKATPVREDLCTVRSIVRQTMSAVFIALSANTIRTIWRQTSVPDRRYASARSG